MLTRSPSMIEGRLLPSDRWILTGRAAFNKLGISRTSRASGARHIDPTTRRQCGRARGCAIVPLVRSLTVYDSSDSSHGYIRIQQHERNTYDVPHPLGIVQRAGVVQSALQAATGGVDVYFDNVGGMVTDAVIPLIKRRARIVICGAIAQYDGGLDTPDLALRFLQHMLFQSATIQGIPARDFVHRMDEMLQTVAPWVKNGEIVYQETYVDGFDALPNALNSLFEGKNPGKLLVRV